MKYKIGLFLTAVAFLAASVSCILHFLVVFGVIPGPEQSYISSFLACLWPVLLGWNMIRLLKKEIK